MAREKIVVGGGCFWCIEAVFKRVDGIVLVTSGYAGGSVDNPTYEAVCTGATGHAEVCDIEFDDATISCDEVLRRFFASHDPTTLNRQGNDVGTQYRSIVLYRNSEQKEASERVRAEFTEQLGGRVVTEIVPLETFYEAEDYHKDYFDRNPNAGYCRVVIAPKLKKLGIPSIPI